MRRSTSFFVSPKNYFWSWLYVFSKSFSAFQATSRSTSKHTIICLPKHHQRRLQMPLTPYGKLTITTRQTVSNSLTPSCCSWCFPALSNSYIVSWCLTSLIMHSCLGKYPVLAEYTSTLITWLSTVLRAQLANSFWRHPFVPRWTQKTKTNSRMFLQKGAYISSYTKRTQVSKIFQKSICRLRFGVDCAALLCLQFLGIDAKIQFRWNFMNYLINLCKNIKL